MNICIDDVKRELNEVEEKLYSLIEKLAAAAIARIDGDEEWKKHCEKWGDDSETWVDSHHTIKSDTDRIVEDLMGEIRGLVSSITLPYEEVY